MGTKWQTQKPSNTLPWQAQSLSIQTFSKSVEEAQEAKPLGYNAPQYKAPRKRVDFQRKV
jgi:hypothetical protein